MNHPANTAWHYLIAFMNRSRLGSTAYWRSTASVADRNGYRPAIGHTSGQGLPPSGDGEGLVLHDVGRLAFDASDGSTKFATPKVLPSNDTALEARIDAAVRGFPAVQGRQGGRALESARRHDADAPARSLA